MSNSYDYLKTNPFTPVFGKVPPYMAGRETIVEDMKAAFFHPDNNPDRCSLFVGARGTGKTALLAFLAHEAESLGWISVNVTCVQGMLAEITQQISVKAAHLLDSCESSRLTGVSVSHLGSISWENPTHLGTWRSDTAARLDELASSDTGLLIAVDEVDPDSSELVQLVTAYQHFVQEDRKVALLLAGLPHRIGELLSGDSTSFLRRAAHHPLGSIPDYEVSDAFRLTVESGGRTIGEEALEAATEAIGGFPFMFQLVGYRAWNAAGNGGVIGPDDLRQGIARAREELEARVFRATYAELSEGDIAFVEAMADIGEEVTRAQLGEALGRSSGYVSTYKKRLLEAGVIEEPLPGRFVFAMPGFREYAVRMR